MPRITWTPVLLLAGLLLQACSSAPQENQVPLDPNAVPELTLNLPGDGGCNCVDQEQRDYTFLERGYSALALGEHIDAVEYFESYRRLEKTPEAAWEADMAIAFISMLPSSPFYDTRAARKSFVSLDAALTANPDMQVHNKAIIMREALEAMVIMDRHIADLENANATLKDDLEKREEALKRLRELTLGQRGARE